MFFHGGCGRRVSHCAEEGRGPGTHPIFRLRAERLRTRLHRSLLFLFLGECSPPLFFRGWGGTPPISKALRCGGGAALLLRKEWRAAGARISLVVRRRCCPSSALELKKRRAANACEAGPRRLAMSPHLWMGAPMFFHGGCGRRVNHCAEEGRGPRHTQSFVSEAKDCRHYSIGVFSARGCCLTRWRLQGMFTPCQRASWAAEPTLLRSFSYEYLARTS